MFKKLVIVGMMSLSLSAFANNMSAAPQKKGLSVPTDSTASRQHYEKPSRVSYVSEKIPDVAEVNEESGEQLTQTAAPSEKDPAKLTPTQPAKKSKRSGGMRY